MSDESRHRVRRGRPMRTTRELRSTAQAAKSRKNGGAVSRARAQQPAPVWDTADSIARMKAIFTELGYDDEMDCDE